MKTFVRYLKTFLRNLGAAVLGWVVMAAVSFVLPMGMWMVLGPEGSFRADGWDTSAVWNAGWMVVAVLGAAAGGFVCSRVAADRRGLWILIAVMVVGGTLTALFYVPAGEGMRPADVGMLEHIPRVARHRLQAAQAGGIGQLVDVDHRMFGG